MRVLLSGGTGFVGRALLPRLASVHEVIVGSRHPEDHEGPGTAMHLDLDDPDTLGGCLDGMEVAYYLLHALHRPDFAEVDRTWARRFGDAAAKAGVGKVVYLGGLGERGKGSAHLRSRHEVGDILGDRVPTVELRASLVLGKGGASYELLRQLVEAILRVGAPAVPGPRALASRTQPIALADAVEYLVAALDLAPGPYDIGAPEAVTYAELMQIEAEVSGRSLHLLPTLPIPARSFAPFAAMLTDQDLLVAHALFDSAGQAAVVEDPWLVEHLSHTPATVAEALAAARR